MAKEPDLAQKVAGAEKPRSFILDASVMDFQEEHKIIQEDIKQNKAVFRFPSGVNKLKLLEECRALTMLDDFEAMYDIAMQMLEDKDLEIYIKNEAGVEVLQTQIHITNRFMDLRGDNFIDSYPVVVTWLAEFIGAMLAKKYPGPGSAASTQVPKKGQTSKAMKHEPRA